MTLIALALIWLTALALGLAIRAIARRRAGSPQALWDRWAYITTPTGARLRQVVLSSRQRLILLLTLAIVLFIAVPMLPLFIGIALDAPPFITTLGVVLVSISLVLWLLLRQPWFMRPIDAQTFWFGWFREAGLRPSYPSANPTLHPVPPASIIKGRSHLFAPQAKPFILYGRCAPPPPGQKEWLIAHLEADDLPLALGNAVKQGYLRQNSRGIDYFLGTRQLLWLAEEHPADNTLPTEQIQYAAALLQSALPSITESALAANSPEAYFALVRLPEGIWRTEQYPFSAEWTMRLFQLRYLHRQADILLVRLHHHFRTMRTDIV